MKVEFIPTPSNIDVIPALEKVVPKLGKCVGVLTTIQHIHKMDAVKTFLEEKGHIVTIYGQVLGCRVHSIKDVDTVLFIGTGNFHPQGIWIKSGMNVLIADPFDKNIREITAEIMEKAEKKKKGSLIKFYSSDIIGVLLSTKPGQRFGIVNELKKRFSDKKFYYFVSGTLDFSQLENFPFVECWINTACPRIYDDQFKFEKGMINLIDIPYEVKNESN